jgi:hypothetical protein
MRKRVWGTMVGLWVWTLAGKGEAAVEPITFYVAPDGRDGWSGRLARPNAQGTDGPLASLAGAREAIRRLKAQGPLGQPVQVLVADGTYPLAEPLVFTPEDSGTEECPITYQAAPGAKPVFTGGRAIPGFQVGPDGLWTVHLPEVEAGKWTFEQLWVNGERATRARSPNQFYHYIRRPAPYGIDPLTGQVADLQNRAFIADLEDIRPLLALSPEELREVNLVVYYAWETARLRLAAVEADTGRVVTTGPGAWKFHWLGRERYHLENFREALDQPGEWFLSRDGTLTYFPRPGEDPATATAVAPVLQEFVRFAGEPEVGLPVEHITLKGLAFEYAGYLLPPQGHSDPQAAVTVPAVILADGARNVALEGCRIAHTGTYGLWFRRGCQHCRVQQCWFEDLGAGGVRIGETSPPYEGGAAGGYNEARRTHHILCDNNIIHRGGRVFAGAVGIWVGQSSDNQVTHNDVSDLFYTGISVGWSWGYADTDCQRNRIEFNHLHRLGQGVLSDMGGVYTLGLSDGTTVSHNVIHDVYAYNRYGYGGLGLYNDEGSTHITLENNLVYNTLDMTYHQHYGRENVVRNNLLVNGQNFQISVHRPEPHLSCTFENNIVYFKTGRLFWATSLDNRRLSFNKNLYWDASGRPLDFMGMRFDQWQALGQDRDSAIADPLFEDPEHLDFRLKPDSPALKLGFKPFDYTQAGLYGDPAWVALAKGFTYPPVEFAPDPPPPPPLRLDEDFENYPLGATPAEGERHVEGRGDAIGVTDETAAGGRKSLKFTDAPGLQFSFDPHLVFQPRYTEGEVRCRFDIRLEPGAEVWHEYRDWSGDPYTIGPSLQMIGGKLKSYQRELMDLPWSQWFRVEVRVGLGDRSPGTWEVVVTLPGREPRRFTDLPVITPGWKKLTWVGFVSNATTETVFYLDNLKLENLAGR